MNSAVLAHIANFIIKWYENWTIYSCKDISTDIVNHENTFKKHQPSTKHNELTY